MSVKLSISLLHMQTDCGIMNRSFQIELETVLTDSESMTLLETIGLMSCAGNLLLTFA